jgi:hypothetical protein
MNFSGSTLRTRVSYHGQESTLAPSRTAYLSPALGGFFTNSAFTRCQIRTIGCFVLFAMGWMDASLEPASPFSHSSSNTTDL